MESMICLDHLMEECCSQELQLCKQTVLSPGLTLTVTENIGDNLKQFSYSIKYG
jgi:hypothetical protein